MREVLDAYVADIQGSDVLERLALDPEGYFLVSAHREENVDDPLRLRMLLQCLLAVRDRWSLPIHVSTHPRTRKRLEALDGWSAPEGVTFHEPLGFHDYVRLQVGAACVLSDSGTIAEEATILGFAAVTLRDSIERPEALDSGGIAMTGLDPDDVVTAVGRAISARAAGELGDLAPAEYLIDNTSVRVVNFMLSTIGRHKQWSGLR
jgi:UDP-N-acetylglucosamine 2-epimerase (non-hydrolysing)